MTKTDQHRETACAERRRAPVMVYDEASVAGQRDVIAKMSSAASNVSTRSRCPAARYCRQWPY
jgi:hypothetical protein